MALRVWIILALLCLSARGKPLHAGIVMQTSARSLNLRQPAPSHQSEITDAPEAFDPEGGIRLPDPPPHHHDSTKVKKDWGLFSRMFSGLITRAIIRDNTDTFPYHRVLDEARMLERYAGRSIRDISVRRFPVFAPPGNKLERFAESIHTQTRETTIRRDLFIKAGHVLDPEQLVRNLQLLRSRHYVATAWFEVVPDAADSTVVDLVLETHDKWTMGVGGGSSLNGPTTIELYDANLFGWGNRLNVATSFDWRHGDYGGNQVEYGIPNVLGSFYEAYFVAGKRFSYSNLGAEVRKDFILPNDYMIGATYMEQSNPVYLIFLDSTFHTRHRLTDGWAGVSTYVKGLRSSLYATGRYSHRRFQTRPDVLETLNPAFHNTDLAIGGLGLYRERFYTANLIYGYGIREYLAAGYRAEINAGYEWGEFEDNWYLGAHYSVGGFSRGGAYWIGGFTLGSYVNPSTGKWHSSGVDFDGRYFSRLFRANRTHIRQFIRTNYTYGWNRYAGNDEVIMFTRERGPLGLREHVFGTNRLNLNSETVYFTPWQPYGFNIALFHFFDVALLGGKPLIFENDFFSTVGVGVRIKNERLIFSALQIRLGFAFGKPGFLKSEYIRFSTQPRVDQYRFLPGPPEVIPFR